MRAVWLRVPVVAVERLRAFGFRLERPVRHIIGVLRGASRASGGYRRWWQSPLARLGAWMRRVGRGAVSVVSRRPRVDPVLDQLEDSFLVVAEDLTICYANAAAKSGFEGSQTLLGRRLGEVFPGSQLIETVRLAMEGKRNMCAMVPLEGEPCRAQGEQKRLLRVEVVPVPLPWEGQRGVWMVLRDDSRWLQMDKLHRDFVANASHEIRASLAIIFGYLEKLAQGIVDDPWMVQKIYGIMLKHSNRMGRMVDSMLSISKWESGPAPRKHELFDVIDSVHETVDYLQPLIQEREAMIRIDFPEENRLIHGERTAWDQVFFNLIENSLRQNEAPGLQVTVRMISGVTHHTLEVVDNGVGIPDQDLGQVFERFFRVERQHARKCSTGTGLGLSIVKTAVEAHGGTIRVTSVPGVETKFSIQVPRHPEAREGSGE